MVDILIFLFIGILLTSILFQGLIYLEGVMNVGPRYEDFLPQISMTSLERIYVFMAGVVLVPIVEELLFRKGIFQYFADKKLTNINIILISGISFGLWHYSGGPAKIVGSTMFGIVLAIMYATTKNVIYPIIGHGINNLMQNIISGFMVSSLDAESYTEYIKSGIKEAIVFSLILLMITSMISYIKRKTIISSEFKDRLTEVFIE